LCYHNSSLEPRWLQPRWLHLAWWFCGTNASSGRPALHFLINKSPQKNEKIVRMWRQINTSIFFYSRVSSIANKSIPRLQSLLRRVCFSHGYSRPCRFHFVATTPRRPPPAQSAAGPPIVATREPCVLLPSPRTQTNYVESPTTLRCWRFASTLGERRYAGAVQTVEESPVPSRPQCHCNTLPGALFGNIGIVAAVGAFATRIHMWHG